MIFLDSLQPAPAITAFAWSTEPIVILPPQLPRSTAGPLRRTPIPVRPMRPIGDPKLEWIRIEQQGADKAQTRPFPLRRQTEMPKGTAPTRSTSVSLGSGTGVT